MDVERTMEFILEQQARTEALLAQITLKQDRFQEQQDHLQREQILADRRLARLARIGVKRLRRLQIEVAEAHDKFNRLQIELAESQKETDKKFNRLLDALNKRSTNGSGEPPLDLPH